MTVSGVFVRSRSQIYLSVEAKIEARKMEKYNRDDIEDSPASHRYRGVGATDNDPTPRT
ncbi:hypothetical protein [Baaleninema simplex]|uniref:hypothetical protein n=1 Tax=Baaleninema simplex TaxID=2862350 RepID=UPI000347BD6A|nr:hypothetical protein [Baaleninema simplex]